MGEKKINEFQLEADRYWSEAGTYWNVTITILTCLFCSYWYGCYVKLST
jgi:hypothetical protein